MKLKDHSFEREKITLSIKIDIRSIVYTSKNHVKCVIAGENVKVFGKIKKKKLFAQNEKN